MAKRISENRFKAFVMFTREPILTFYSQELEYFSNDKTTILGTIVFDLTDKDYNCIVLCRDEAQKFRAIDIKACLRTIEKAREWINKKIDWHTEKGTTTVNQGGIKKGVDLFKIIINEKKIHPYFKRLNEDLVFKPAKKVITELSRYFEDIDGNFIEQFQSINGFDARLWEIYLFCFLTEEKFKVKRDNDRPDFIIEKFNEQIALEAVIVDRKPENPPQYITGIKEKLPEEIRKENENDMPLRFSSPLFSKLKKKYWELPHVKGKAIILAIADFHDDQSMTWSFNAIIDYLYGLKFNFHHDEKGELILNPEKIKSYIKKTGVEIEPGYFFQPEVENISAVLFSSTATISKFSRIGVQAGFKVGDYKIFRVGANYKHDPNASIPDMFFYEVDEGCQETWAEGVNLFHNPNAKIKVDKRLFPSIAHHELIENNIHSLTPEFHPYFSYNYNLIPKLETEDGFEE